MEWHSKSMETVLQELDVGKETGLMQEEAVEIVVVGGRVRGVKTAIGAEYLADTVIVATGVYLNGRIIIGEYVKESGPSGMMNATRLTQNLIDIGLPVRRFKTGTPARVLKTSLDLEKMEMQSGEPDCSSFSFLSTDKLYDQIPCYLTYTNQETHRIIRENIHRSPLYNGSIQGVGPRYCPSIEDKVMRFKDKERHQIFIEPEGGDTLEMYVQGMSSSLPFDVQIAMYRSVVGMENVEIMRYAYAIEYDCIDPTAMEATLMARGISGLFLAGQVNGSSGYEEAAAQGLVAGINAGQYLRGEAPLILARDEAYIGVLIDDLVTKGTNEPYRIMTARAEYRLSLRQGNADLRLTEKGYKLGLASEERYAKMLTKRANIEAYLALLDKHSPPSEFKSLLERKGESYKETGMSYRDILKRNNVSALDFIESFPSFRDADLSALTEVEIIVKYEGYMKRQQALLRDVKQLEQKELPAEIEYNLIKGLRVEAQQKLDRIRPRTLGQASRISGV